jgi:hypothetical protein
MKSKDNFNYEEFDNKVDKEMISSLYNTENNRVKKEYKEVPDGEYIVAITSLFVGYTKSSNRPVLKCTFKVVEGEYENSCMFMNQLLTSQYPIKIARDFLKSLGTTKPDEVVYDNYDGFKLLTERIFEEIKGKVEYGIKYGTNANGYKEFKITDIYDLV